MPTDVSCSNGRAPQWRREQTTPQAALMNKNGCQVWLYGVLPQATDKGRRVTQRSCPRNTLRATIEKTTSYLSTFVFAPRERIAGVPAATEENPLDFVENKASSRTTAERHRPVGSAKVELQTRRPAGMQPSTCSHQRPDDIDD
ncbi:unnamed protein product [Pleuronectes platessa]|uniref:Uncharacterized protein n=1 Tax=Pleuronectes platessa TaxID=8262 RepID=A0A9N7V0L9_PLEPL|nr:unnamed protein product [Pleuronectes platessa]